MKTMGALVVAVVVGAGMLAMGLQPEAGKKPAAGLAELGFLNGTWTGLMEGDPVVETWGTPSGDAIIGMFRWEHEGKITMSELLFIRVEEAGPTLRLRHFGADFAPWKGECEALAALTAEPISGTRVKFVNKTEVGGLAYCEYACPTPEKLDVTVAFKEDRRPALKFSLTRGK